MDYRKLTTEICRIILGATFIFSGIVKAVDPVGGTIQMEEYFAAFRLTVLNPVAMPVFICLSAFEFLLGVCMLTAIYRKLTATCMLAFMTFMTLFTFYLAIFNPVHDCGCFGEAIKMTNWQTFFKNFLVLLPASIIVFMYYKRMKPLYTHKVYWFVAFFAYAFAVAFSYYNYYKLPIADFRPYKVGANIPEMMSFPDDAPQDEYEYIYEKSGEKKSFTPESSPADDSTWTYVEAKLVKKGYTPPVSSFELYNDSDENIADQILSDSSGVFLLIAPRLEKASDKNIDEISDLYDYAIEHNMLFYCATSSTKQEIENWINDTGAEYDFLTADDVTLKTIIRSNPGLILLKSGTILQKWHYNNIPAEEEHAIIAHLLNLPKGKKEKKRNPWIPVTCIFILPLVLVWAYDFGVNRKKNINTNDLNIQK